MNLYKISQEENNDYDTYDSAVVVAENEEDAKVLYPRSTYIWEDNKWTATRADGSKYTESNFSVWTKPEHVEVEYLGKAKAGLKAGTIVCASFNAG